MTDAELTALVADLATTDPKTTPGVTAIFTLAAKLGAEPEFVDQPIRVVPSGQGSHTVSAEFVAQRMLNTARTSGKTAAEAVAWFRKIPSMTRAVGGAVKALYGVKCTEKIALSDDVVLLPYSELPQSETRDWILQEHDRANDARILHGFTVPPQAALYRTATVEPFFSPHGHDFKKSPQAQWFNDLDSAALLLALTPKAIPAEAAHWMHYDDPEIAMVGQFGIARNIAEFPTKLSEPTLITPESAAGLLTAFRKVVKGGDRARLQLALTRLIRSRNQINPGDRAIDLSIALEVLFMNQDQAEHTYKISLRVARLVRTSLAERRTTFVDANSVYAVRSGMVHTGRVKDDYKNNAYELVERTDVHCCEAIRKFLDSGQIPESWRDIELS